MNFKNKRITTQSSSREDSDSEEADSQQSRSHDDEEDQIKAYVAEFRREVENKFRASTTNVSYRFPRKTVQKYPRQLQDSDSLCSLLDVTYYDLDSQNTKRDLLGGNNSTRDRKGSETQFLVDVVRRLGKLDGRYLASQLGSPKSPFFRLLYNSVQRKAQKARRSVDGLKSCSIKTKSIVMAKKSARQLETTAGSGENIAEPKKPSKPIPNLNLLTLHSTKQKTTARNLLQRPTHMSSVSPNSHQSRISLIGKAPNQNPAKLTANAEAMRNTGRLRKNFSGNSGLKITHNNSVKCLKRNADNTTVNTSVFNAVKKNLLSPTYNSNSNVSTSLINTYKTKSKSKEVTKEVKNLPVVQKNPNDTSKNQISLTKDQLRSLIQKNIYKKPQVEVEKKPQIVDKLASQSARRRLDRVATAVNLYNHPQETSQPLKLQKRKETFKKVYQA